MPQTDLEQAIAAAITNLDFGEVVSYGDVATRAGKPRAHRAVGRFLKTTEINVPWWRVVYSNGSLPPINPDEQTRRLQDEGVNIERDRVTSAPRGRFSS